MSIAQKGPTWLPRFWRKSEVAVLGNGMDERPHALDERPEPTPLDDRLPGRRLAELNLTEALRPASTEVAAMASALPSASVDSRIHPLACVDRRARIADDVEIGPFCVVGPDVTIGRGSRLMNNVTIIGRTTMGENNVCFPNAVLGAQPQDKKFKGEDTRLEIGDNNHFREGCTVHSGTGKGGGVTRVGSGNLFMVNCHLGHDVVVGDNCIFANNVMLAGHVHIGNAVVLSGAVGIHHFVTVGDYVYAGGQTKISHDVPPFVKVDESNKIRGVNSVGLRRNGFNEVDVSAVEQTIWKLFLDRDRKPLNVTLREIRSGAFPELAANGQVQRVLEFLDRRNLGRHGRYLESLRAG